MLVCAAQRALSQAEHVALWHWHRGWSWPLTAQRHVQPGTPSTVVLSVAVTVSTVCLQDTQQPPVTGPQFVTHMSQVRTTAAEESPQSQEWQREHSLRLPAQKLGAQPVDALGGLSLLSWSHGSSAVSPLAALAAAVSPATCRALSAAGL